MSQNLHLAAHEKLLLSLKPAGSVVIKELFLGIIEGAILGAIVWSVGLIFLQEELSVIPLIIGIIVLLAAIFRRFKSTRHEVLTVTTDRIMVLMHEKFFFHRMHTLKWTQYQECIVERRSPLDVFFGARPLSIRYGAADSKLFLHVMAIPYAADIKHYFDKIDGLIRRNALAEINPFILKKKGQRDL